MDQNVLVAIVVVVAVVLIIAAVIISRKRRRERLRENFGPEYDRAVALHGGAAKAEAALADREKRVHSYTIRHLSDADRQTFTSEWETVQRRFVDDPAMAVSEADSLVNRVMTARGYPMADFDQRAADVSVNYPTLVQHYRLGHDIALRHRDGQAGTEDLRQAMVHYRSLFSELLEPASADATTYQRV